MKKLHRAFSRRAACIGLTAVMSATFIAGQVLAFADNKQSADGSQVQTVGFTNANGKFDLTDIKLSNLSKQVTQSEVSTEIASLTRSVIVTLEGKALSERGDESLSAQREIEWEQEKFLSKLKKSGVGYTLKSRYSSVINAVAIDVKLSELQKIKSIDGVSTVSVGSTYERPKAIETSDGAQINYSSIYENGIYKSEEYLKDYADGSGMTVAILDTGLDYTHPAFAASQLDDPSAVSFTYDKVSDLMSDVRFRSTGRNGATVDDVYISEKVPYAYDYADSDSDVYPSYSQHGTHVAGIIGGKADSYTNKDGETATYVDDNGQTVNLPFRGVAPEAQLVICKVFTDNLEDENLGGADAVDILDALEDCYNLNVDIVNMSLGTSAGFSSKALGLTEGDEEGALMDRIYKNLRSKGITMMIAASNDYSAGYGSAFGTNLTTNPDSGTVGSPSTFTGAMSVASINGQYSPYFLANATINGDSVTGGDAIYYEESRNEDSDAFNFLNDLLGCDKAGCTDEYHESMGLHRPENIKQRATFKYVVIPGTGEAGDYTSSIRNELANKEGYDKVIAVVRRGNSSFKDKIETAKANKADAVITYNNVSGMIRMSLGDMQEHIPAVSISLTEGLLLTGSGATRKTKGTITLDRSYLAGPFMNDYSSWGSTPDLKLKPDVTSHGGEITSTVAGGYEEMSGTSMACPNLSGFTALLKSYLKREKETLWQGTTDNDEFALTKLTNNILMSTATTVYDQNKLPYSPRKQGAGLATMANVFSTNAYLYTDESDGMCEDGRPKAELGEDSKKKGVYTMKFYVRNFGESALEFKTNSIFMTETVGADGKSVAEVAHLFGDDAEWTVGGKKIAEGGAFTVSAGQSVSIEVTLTLTNSEKRYLNDNFKNGMFVEGFLQLKSSSNGQCDLNFPFMGFYGSWKDAPMMDLTAFDVAEDARDTSLKDEERRKPSVWATQAFGYYYNEQYNIPLGSFVYLQDEAKEHTADYVYTDEEHIAISHFNEYYGDGNTSNYLTTTGIRALYAGLLRNAEIVTYTLTNVDTGEVVVDDKSDENGVREFYRANKAYSAGGSAVPSLVQLEMRTAEMGLTANGKYRLDFNFYFDYDDYEAYKNGDANAFKDEDGNTYGVYQNNTFSMNFYVDYEAPILVDSRVRFQDRQDENGKKTQRVYLDFDIFDNHYPQALLLCYSESDEVNDDSTNAVRLATEYITPIINPRRNTTNTVTIDITDYYEDYKGRLFVELQDYALNSNMYYLDFNYSQTSSVCPTDFTVMYDGKNVNTLTIDKNSAATLSIGNIGNANLSNFIWESNHPEIVSVKNGEIFGVRAGTARITVTGGNNRAQQITVTVKDSDKTLKLPSVSFGTMLNSKDVPVSATGIVTVNPAQKFRLNIVPDPWYYPIEQFEFEYRSSDPTLAVVDEKTGEVTVMYEGDKIKNVTITATAKGYPAVQAQVVLSIVDPYTITNGVLSKYRGWGGELVDGRRILTIPGDRAITSIGDEAFKDSFNDPEHLTTIIVPKAVTSIGERAFIDCKSLEKICFISEEAKTPADSSLTIMHIDAFSGCDRLKTVDLSNCKVITLDRNVFAGCTALEEVVKMSAIGTLYNNAFSGCTSLKKADITDLHVAFGSAFSGCTSLTEVKTGANTAMNRNMFSGCTSLESVEINCGVIPAYAFNGCSSLKTVKLGADVTIGAYAFANCSRLNNFDLNGHTVSSIGDYAFSNCVNINDLFDDPNFKPTLGANVFQHVSGMDGVVVIDNVLYSAGSSVTSSALPDGVTVIGPYAFADSVLTGVDTVVLTGVTSIGTGAFYRLYGLTNIVLPDGLTEIPDNAFRGTALTSIVIPASVKSIGKYAFASCSSLASVTFADGSQLKSIGANAFDGTAITALTLPDGVTTIGDEAFANNPALTRADISSVTYMGEGVFARCPVLATATFGANATATGTYTFFAGNNSDAPGASALTSVELSDKILSIGEGVFAYCANLAAIDLKNVTEIGDDAFNGCVRLSTVTGIERVKLFGSGAFVNCTAISSLNLAAAEVISYRGFFNNSSLAAVTFGAKLDGIGDEAFAESAVTTVTIPASCNYVGVSAFSGAANLYEYVVDGASKYYFAEQGVLYRYIDKDNGKYELCAYPAGRTATASEGVATYKIKEGTVSTQAFAFYSIPSAKVGKVILPYTLKTIGNGTFFNSGITTYQFESIEAPTLLEDIALRTLETNAYSHNSFFYNNFVTFLANYALTYPGEVVDTSELPVLTILYPENGTGYDNFVYSSYFGTKTKLEEMPEDDARTLRELLTSAEFYSAETVSGWKNDGSISKAQVEAFAAEVTRAHVLYNGLSSDVQRQFVGQENLDRLFAVEAALKTVKKDFGITVRVSSVALSENSTHKTAYNAGERFSMNGIKLIITYDDYSREEIDAASGFVIAERFNRELRSYDEAVDLEGTGDYAGRTISIRINVSDGGSSVDGNSGHINVLTIVLVICGGVALLAVAAVVTVIVLMKKKVIVVKSAKSEAKDEEEADKQISEMLGEENANADGENANADGDESVVNSEITEIAEDSDSGEHGEEGNTDD